LANDLNLVAMAKEVAYVAGCANWTKDWIYRAHRCIASITKGMREENEPSKKCEGQNSAISVHIPFKVDIFVSHNHPEQSY